MPVLNRTTVALEDWELTIILAALRARADVSTVDEARNCKDIILHLETRWIDEKAYRK